MNNQNTKPTDNKPSTDENRLTRSRTQENPELRNLVENLNDPPVFSKSRKTPRSPIKQRAFDFTQETTTVAPNTDTKLGAIPKNRNINNLTIDANKSAKATAEGQDKKLEIVDFPPDNNKQTEFFSSPPHHNNTNKTETPRHALDSTFRHEISLFEIEGITEQPSLIGNSDKKHNQESVILDWGNTTNNMPELQNQMQPLRLPLKYVANLVPEFDGTNISVTEYIEKLKHAKNILAPVDEPGLIPILKIKLKGEVYKALINSPINNINDFIQAIKLLLPSNENIHSLYAKLTELMQKPDESVLSYGNRLQELVIQIKELKSSEPGMSQQNIQNFDRVIRNDAEKSFRNGLRQEIRLELKQTDNLDALIQEAINVESRLKKQNIIRGDPASILCSFGKSNANSAVYTCQICQDPNHEALFCDNAACVYCKSKDHLSYNCRFVKNKIELFCKYCNAQGHSIDACKMNRSKGNHCQYCQVMGHTVSQCPFIIEYEVCWKCKRSGHDPNTCAITPNVTESCEFCNSINHTIKNCPTVMCQRCNKLGHTLKYCPIMKNTSFQLIMCAICNEEGHNAEECEEARVLVSQNRTRQYNQVQCQICNRLGHSAGNCHKLQNPQHKPNNPYRDNHNFKHNNNNFHTKYKQNNNFNNSSQFRNNSRNEPQKFCDYCKIPNHTIEECRKLKNLETRAQRRDICSYCKETGHLIDACRKLKELERSSGKFCNVCKNTSHATEECYRGQGRQIPHRPGNE